MMPSNKHFITAAEFVVLGVSSFPRDLYLCPIAQGFSIFFIRTWIFSSCSISFL